jgi:hypothetical protein
LWKKHREERTMPKRLLPALVAAAAIAVIGSNGGNPAYAKSEKAAKAQLQECKKRADPKLKDECVRKAGKGTENEAKSNKGGKKEKGK